MKNRQGGYVLPLVMVVLVVLCLAVVAALGFSGERLAAQQRGLTRTQLHYDFLGRLEQLKAVLNHSGKVKAETEQEAEEAAKSEAQNFITASICQAFDLAEVTLDDNKHTFAVTLQKDNEFAGYTVSVEWEVHVNTVEDKFCAEYYITAPSISWEYSDSRFSGGVGA